MISNKEVRLVFQPKDQTLFNNRRRFGVGAGRLASYITKHNYEVVEQQIEKHLYASKYGRIRVKFRKFGIVDVYLK